MACFGYHVWVVPFRRATSVPQPNIERRQPRWFCVETMQDGTLSPMVRKYRQHVNPLSRKHRTPVDLDPEWPATSYRTLEQNFHVDIGCAGGRFCLEMAKRYPDWNFLGVEIREPPVIKARHRLKETGLGNVDFLRCNVNVDGRELLSRLPKGSLRTVSILFPDPWFKTRHRKRRVVKPELVVWIAQFMVPGGRVVLHSDVLDISVDMRREFEVSPYFSSEDGDPEAWVEYNSFEVASERETLVLEEGRPVYRKVYTRLGTSEALDCL